MAHDTPLQRLKNGVNTLFDAVLGAGKARDMEDFKLLLDDLWQMGAAHEGVMHEWEAKIAPDIHHIRRAQGGDCLHRGILNPSPILDLLVADCNRGIPLDPKAALTGEPYYEFLYDAADRLIGVRHYAASQPGTLPKDQEFILRRGVQEYGITFETATGRVLCVCKAAKPHGYVESYAFTDFDPYGPSDMVLHYEYFTYTGERLSGAEVYFAVSPELGQYDRDVYEVLYEEAPDGKDPTFGAPMIHRVSKEGPV